MRVYISSTQRDLVPHRAAVATVLRRMGHLVIGMEDYVAAGQVPLKKCLDDVGDAGGVRRDPRMALRLDREGGRMS